MRRFLFIAVVCILPFISCDAGKKEKNVKNESIVKVVSEYRGEDGFEMVSLGKLATSAIKSAIRIASDFDDDPDLKEVRKAIQKIDKAYIVEFEDVREEVRKEIVSRLDDVFDDTDLLMEIKSDDDKMRIYGVVSDDNQTVRDFVLYVPEDCTLICLSGSVSMDPIFKLMEQN